MRHGTDNSELEPFLREIDAICDKHYPGGDGRKMSAYMLLGAAVRRLLPFYGKSGAQEEVIKFMTDVRAKQVS